MKPIVRRIATPDDLIRQREDGIGRPTERQTKEQVRLKMQDKKKKEPEPVERKPAYDKQKGRRIAETVYMAATGISLIGSLYVMLSWAPDAVTPVWLILIRCFSALSGVLLNRRKDRGICILAAYLGLVFLRLLIPEPYKLFTPQASDTLFHGVWAFLGCYSLGFVLDERKTAGFLRGFLALWCFGIATLSAAAIFAAWTDRLIWNIGQGAFLGLDTKVDSSARLRIFFDVNTTGAVCGLSAVMAAIGFVTEKSRAFRGFYLLILIPIWFALSLTDCRTAQISTAAGCGIIAGILLLNRTRKRKERRIPSWISAVLVTLITSVFCLILSVGCITIFNAAKSSRGSFVRSAGAEAPESAVFRVSIEPAVPKAGIGETIRLKAEVQNEEGEPCYQWQVSWDGVLWNDLGDMSPDSGTLKVRVKAGTYRNQYRCKVITGNDTLMSETVTIQKPFTVRLARSIQKRPDGNRTKLTVKTEDAEGDIHYQWQVFSRSENRWEDTESDEDAPDRLTVEMTEETRYRCIVTAGNGVVISASKTIGEAKGILAKNRGYIPGNVLSGRQDIWLQVIDYLRLHPGTLLTGRSISDPMKGTGIMRIDSETEHCHNGLLQTLMESGIPGAVLMIGFMTFTGICACRMVRRRGGTMIFRLLPAAVLSVWIGETTECIVRMSNSRVPNLPILMLFAGVICALGSKNSIV